MSPEQFDAWQVILSRVESIEQRVAQMDVELTATVVHVSDAQHGLVTLTKEVSQMTDSFRAFRNALYAAAATIVAAAVLVIVLGQHP